MNKSIHVKVTSAVAVAGEILRPNAIVQLQEREAINLLERGKVVVATADDIAAFEAEQPAASGAEADGTPAPDQGEDQTQASDESGAQADAEALAPAPAPARKTAKAPK